MAYPSWRGQNGLPPRTGDTWTGYTAGCTPLEVSHTTSLFLFCLHDIEIFDPSLVTFSYTYSRHWRLSALSVRVLFHKGTDCKYHYPPYPCTHCGRTLYKDHRCTPWHTLKPQWVMVFNNFFWINNICVTYLDKMFSSLASPQSISEFLISPGRLWGGGGEEERAFLLLKLFFIRRYCYFCLVCKIAIWWVPTVAIAGTNGASISRCVLFGAGGTACVPWTGLVGSLGAWCTVSALSIHSGFTF